MSTLTSPEPQTRETAPTLRGWYALMVVGGGAGVVTAAWQTVERIAYAKDPGSSSICEINAVLSCSSVFDHWQSSALGIPNSLIALPVFAVLAFTGLAGLLGSALSRGYLATVLGLTVFMTGFITWYLEQSAFALSVLCLFCLGCAVSLLVAGVGVTRVAVRQGALGTGRAGRAARLEVEAGGDLVVWAGWGLLIALMLVLGLAF